ncbi:MAG: hypothetical protein IKN94_12880 [Salinivirgaceae bacterium]|nr:hypothetical protein [Salinivirgaceae bacterium]
MSFDTVHFRLTADEAQGTDFLAETPCYLSDVKQTTFADGSTALTGYLAGNGNIYTVSVTERRVKIIDGSLCKWHLGNNLSELDRKETQRAIENLSDRLHLPIDRADIPKLHFALNLRVCYQPNVYYNHFGALSHYSRLTQPTAIYYSQENEQFVFYDKLKEQKREGAFIPELYRNSNLLRIEQRYNNRVSTRLGCKVVGSMLYDEHFFNMLLYRWRDTYSAIKKINDVTPNFNAMTTKKDLYKMGVLSLIERAGGTNEMLSQIVEAQQMGILTKKQAFDLREVVNEAGKIDENIIVPNEAIVELDEKVKRAVKFFNR